MQILLEDLVLEVPDLAFLDFVLIQDRRNDVPQEVLSNLPLRASLLASPVGHFGHQDIGLLLAEHAILAHILLVDLDVAAGVDAVAAGAEEVVEKGSLEHCPLDQIGESHVRDQTKGFVGDFLAVYADALCLFYICGFQNFLVELAQH